MTIRIILYTLFFIILNSKTFGQFNEKSDKSSKKVYAAKTSLRISGRFCKIIIKESDTKEITVSSKQVVKNDQLFQQKLMQSLQKDRGFEINELPNRLDIYINPAFSNNSADTNAVVPNSMLKEITVSIPAGTLLDINSDYGNVIIHTNIKKANLKINNATLDAADIEELQLNGVYCNANVGNIKNGIIQYNKSTLNAMQIDDLDLDSKNSTIDYSTGKRIYIISNLDEINIQSIEEVDGRTNWGNINITELHKSLTLRSINTNLKLRKIVPGTEYIRINNTHGEMRLSLRNIENYAVDFTGKGSNTITPFEKKYANGEKEPVSMAGNANKNIVEKFKGSSGNIDKTHTRVEVICDACLVDFK